MKKLDTSEMRRVEGGRLYCTLCSYSCSNFFAAMGHMATKHPYYVAKYAWEEIIMKFIVG